MVMLSSLYSVHKLACVESKLRNCKYSLAEGVRRNIIVDAQTSLAKFVALDPGNQ